MTWNSSLLLRGRIISVRSGACLDAHVMEDALQLVFHVFIFAVVGQLFLGIFAFALLAIESAQAIVCNVIAGVNLDRVLDQMLRFSFSLVAISAFASSRQASGSLGCRPVARAPRLYEL